MWTKMRTQGIAAALMIFAVAAANAAAAARYDVRGIVVAMLDRPQSILIGRSVEDRNGRPIGRVHSIDTDREGKAGAVNIEVGAVRNRGAEIVAVDAHQIVYYPQKGTLVASLDPPPVRVPAMAPNAPERASVKRPPPPPPIFQQ
jgi:hypothetical protein